MAEKPNPPAEPSQEEPLVKGEELFEPLAKLNKFRKYWKTRNAILSGVRVYDMLKNDREKEGYLGAWEFNTAQSALAAMPTIVMGLILAWFGIKSEGSGFVEHWFQVVWAVCIPFVLMLAAYTVGRFSLWKQD